MIKACILFGGKNSEHEVSLRSSSSVLRNIPTHKYQVEMVGITKEGKWLHYTGDIDAIENNTWQESGKTCPAVLSPDSTHKGILLMDRQGVRVLPVDVVFPVLHGKNGEDGTIQGLLEMAGIPYVGSGVLSSALCMDKDYAHRLLTLAGVPKTKLVCVHREEIGNLSRLEADLLEEIGLPMFVKPANAGSSVGVSRVETVGEIVPALEEALLHDVKAVVEQEVVGREIECSVMGNENPVAAPDLGEITPASGFYDYNAKYLDDSAGLHVPAALEEKTIDEIRGIAVKAYRTLNCRGLCRVDFFLRPDGSPVLNELNTLPGFTSISMYPKLFEAGGMAYPEVVDRLLSLALEEAE